MLFEDSRTFYRWGCRVQHAQESHYRPCLYVAHFKHTDSGARNLFFVHAPISEWVIPENIHTLPRVA